MLQICENIRQARKLSGKTQQEMADMLDVKRSTYANWETTIQPDIEIIRTIAKVLSVSWTELAGGGSDPHNNVPEKRETYIQKRNSLKNNSKADDVPVTGGYSSLGNAVLYNDDGEKETVIATLPQAIFPGCNHGEKAKGDSMYPLIMNQAWLVGKICQPSGIVYGEKYIIRTKDGMDTTKFIHPAKDAKGKQVPGRMKLVAYNKNIPDQDIEMNDITFACRVLWIINPT